MASIVGTSMCSYNNRCQMLYQLHAVRQLMLEFDLFASPTLGKLLLRVFFFLEHSVSLINNFVHNFLRNCYVTESLLWDNFFFYHNTFFFFTFKNKKAIVK